MILLLCCGCSLFRSYDERTFSFNYDGIDFEIVSKIQSDKVLENILLMYNKNGEIIFEGIDQDSDGQLDELRQGKISLAEANKIYYVGIEQALESGDLDSTNEVRMFTFSAPPYTYTVETIGYDDYTSRRRMVYGYLKEVAVYNDFTITHTENNTKIAIRDMDADGYLDAAVSPENIDFSEYQIKYRNVLDEGLSSNRIMLRDLMYIVVSNK